MTESGAAVTDESWPARFVDELREQYGVSVAAIVLYGSWLRGKRDTVLDFYVLLDDYKALTGRAQRLLNRILPPNVYNVVIEQDGVSRTAKYATMSLEHFERAITRDFHSYFWARFAQPVVIVYARSVDIATRVERACERAAARMITETSASLAPEFTTAELWQRAFTLTYSCELRSEKPAKLTDLAASYAGHLETLTATVAADCRLQALGGQRWQAVLDPATRRHAASRWRARRIQGKVLSIARLFKAAFTFNRPLDYILWKVERHTGIREEPSPLQRRHPLLFSWPLLWRIYRRGGFR